MISTDTPANVTPDACSAQRDERGDPGSKPVVWAAAYLAVSGLILGIGGDYSLCLVHLTLLALLAGASLTRSTVSRLLLDFAPPAIVIGLAYGEVPALIAALGRPYHDAMIQRWDLTLFGVQPAHTLASHLPNTWISELLHGGYMSYYLGISIPPLLLYARGEHLGFRQTTFALIVTWLVGCGLFVLVPVEGPRYLWSAPLDVPDGPMRRLSVAILSAGSARGTAFPSLHMAASLSQTILAWRWQSRLVRLAMSAMCVLVGIGAVYAGYHYAADILVGAAGGLVTTIGVLGWLSFKARAKP